MNNKKHIIIFARAPRFGRGKRRLARDIGNLRACLFYQQNLKRIIAELSSGPWNLHIAVPSRQDAKHPLFADLSVIVQPQGNLGRKMCTVLTHFRNTNAVIVGSDIHGISRNHLNHAFRTLATHDVVFGPAFDGGFWLVGCGRRRALSPNFMRGVRWSSQYALEDALATVPPGYRVGEVTQLHDIDDGDSYQRFYG